MKEKIEKAVAEFLEFAKEDPQVLSDFEADLRNFFDDLEEADYFGTEGQCYPFGDKRN